MKIAVTGRLGQVAASLVERAARRRDLGVVTLGPPPFAGLDSISAGGKDRIRAQRMTG